MNKSIKASQGGFTLIELIVVIVILGILAATALPKFTNLSGEARLASINAARGSLLSTSAMIHGKVLVSPTAMTGGNVTVEGVVVPMDTTGSQYPTASAKLAEAAGLGAADYTIYTKDSPAGTGVPSISGANQFALVPNSLVGTTAATTCYVLYTAALGANTAPTATLVGTGTTAATAASCQ
ncbi:type II secretion system protein [Massilia sp. Dwa41.01b]|uniref:type II secretion system protein n=1 Tax=unclassified Massilia TaxID=2609279 RepID=UPI00160433B8|nr:MULTISPECIES: type II secretion system protein [unclassified Massilia]QNA88881.1 type II secretion system protein [Massilia sp. Dwa41.01b]QNA99773.1 type II secretion system protein [Massilia sp. Se16.2.3]